MAGGVDQTPLTKIIRIKFQENIYFTFAFAREIFASFPLLIKKYAASLNICRSVAGSVESSITKKIKNNYRYSTEDFILPFAGIVCSFID